MLSLDCLDLIATLPMLCLVCSAAGCWEWGAVLPCWGSKLADAGTVMSRSSDGDGQRIETSAERHLDPRRPVVQVAWVPQVFTSAHRRCRPAGHVQACWSRGR